MLQLAARLSCNVVPTSFKDHVLDDPGVKFARKHVFQFAQVVRQPCCELGHRWTHSPKFWQVFSGCRDNRTVALKHIRLDGPRDMVKSLKEEVNIHR